MYDENEVSGKILSYLVLFFPREGRVLVCCLTEVLVVSGKLVVLSIPSSPPHPVKSSLPASMLFCSVYL